MKNKQISYGSLSLLLVIVAFLWSFNIFGFCMGDFILNLLNIPSWSNNVNSSGIHYTIYYALLFLIPALILGLKFKNNLFSKIGTVLSVIFIVILVMGLFFIIV